MRLIVESTDVTSGSIPVRWCITQDEQDQLVQNLVEHAHILISLEQNGNELDRYLVPLSNLMTYVQFRRAGTINIHAQIVFPHDSIQRDINEMKGYIRARVSTNRFYNFVLDRNGSSDTWFVRWNHPHCNCLESSTTQLSVNVPDSLFAQNPSRWEYDWVNLWYETPPRDQCHFRRRRFVAYTIQPPVILCWSVVMIITRTILAIGCLLLGLRGKIGWGTIVHPIRAKTSDLWANLEGGSIFFTRADGDSVSVFRAACCPMIPLVLLAILYVIWLIPILPLGKSVSIWWLVITAMLAPFAAVSIIKLVAITFNMLKWLGLTTVVEDVFDNVFDTIETWCKKHLIDGRPYHEKLADEYQPVACPGPDKQELLRPAIDALPKRHRTIRLRYLDLKARVCKPFAR